MIQDQPEYFANDLLVHNCAVKHVPGLKELETQMVTWEPPTKDPVSGKVIRGSSWSPDGVDALVHVVRRLIGRSGTTVKMVPRPSMTPSVGGLPTTRAALSDPSGRQAAAIAQRLGLYAPGAN